MASFWSRRSTQAGAFRDRQNQMGTNFRIRNEQDSNGHEVIVIDDDDDNQEYSTRMVEGEENGTQRYHPPHAAFNGYNGGRSYGDFVEFLVVSSRQNEDTRSTVQNGGAMLNVVPSDGYRKRGCMCGDHCTRYKRDIGGHVSIGDTSMEPTRPPPPPVVPHVDLSLSLATNNDQTVVVVPVSPPPPPRPTFIDFLGVGYE